MSRALALIAEGGLDGEAGMSALCERLGVGERQLRRLFDKHLGAPPIAVAQTRRILFAKQLIHETQLPMTAIALASGFGSVRRFNDAFRKLYRRPPSELRRHERCEVRLVDGHHSPGYRPPYDWDAMLSFLAARAMAGVELVDRNRYARTIELDGEFGSVRSRTRHEPSCRHDPFSATCARCWRSSPGCGGCSISTPMSKPSARISRAMPHWRR